MSLSTTPTPTDARGPAGAGGTPGPEGADHPGRDRDQRSRPRAGARSLLVALVVSLLAVGGAVVALHQGEDGGGPAPVGNALMENQNQAELGRGSGQQVLGGDRVPGQPTVQRLRHDDVVFTVTVAPSLPGPNLVRVDVAGKGHQHGTEGYGRTLLVGTPQQDQAGGLVAAEPRPGADGLWAVVDLPPGQATVVVSHGPKHRVPFAVATGDEELDDDQAALWTGPEGPECLSAATAAVLAGGSAPSACPSSGLADTDAATLTTGVSALLDRGVQQIALQSDDTQRSQDAADLVQDLADDAGVEVVDPDQAPAARSALVVVSGWSDAADTLADITALPVTQQPMRTDGTWLAPWLLTPEVVDSTLGAVLPLDFDIRQESAQDYSQALTEYLPGQFPTASGFEAWRAATGEDAADVRLFAASRAAIMPRSAGSHHETEVQWFPEGTVTPVS